MGEDRRVGGEGRGIAKEKRDQSTSNWMAAMREKGRTHGDSAAAK